MNIINRVFFFALCHFILSSQVYPQLFEDTTPLGIPNLLNGSAELFDANNDGDLDLAIMGNYSTASPADTRYGTILKNASGSISDDQISIVGLYNGSISVGDYNQDGWIDLLLSGQYSDTDFRTRLIKNNGGYDFEEVSVPFLGVDGKGSDFIDYDNDGDLDVLVSGDEYDSDFQLAIGAIRLYENLGNDKFKLVNTNFLNLDNPSTDIGDIDQDGDLDIVHMGYYFDNFEYVCMIYRNNGDKTFTLENSGLVGLENGDLKLIDYNNDYLLDIVKSGNNYVANHFRSFYVATNDGTSFSETRYLDTLGVDYCHIEIFDFNFDDRPDILVSGNGEGDTTRAFLLENTGSEFKFSNEPILPAIKSGVMVSGDFTEDDRPDLIIVGTGVENGLETGYTRFLRNSSTDDVYYNPHTDNLNSIVTGNDVYLSWDRSPFRNATYNIEVYDSNNRLYTTQVSDTSYRWLSKATFEGNAGHNNFFLLKDLPVGLYRWRMQCITPYFVTGTYTDYHEFEIIEELEENYFIDVELDYFAEEDISDNVLLIADYDFNGSFDIYFSGLNNDGSVDAGILINYGGGQSFSAAKANTYQLLPNYDFYKEGQEAIFPFFSNDYYSSYRDFDPEVHFYYDNYGLVKYNMSPLESNPFLNTLSSVAEEGHKHFYGKNKSIDSYELTEYTDYWGQLAQSFPNTISISSPSFGDVKIRDYTLTHYSPLHDLNKDGYDDLLTQSGIYFVTEDGVNISTILPKDHQYMNWYDVNSDGKLDVTTTNPNIVFLNRGDSMFVQTSLNTTLSVEADVNTIVSHYIDIDNNGVNDLVLASESYSYLDDSTGFLEIRLNTGDLSFNKVLFKKRDIFLQDLEFADINNDNSLDIVYSWREVQAGQLLSDINLYQVNSGVNILYSTKSNWLPAAPNTIETNLSGKELHVNWEKGFDFETPDSLLSYTFYLEDDIDYVYRNNYNTAIKTKWTNTIEERIPDTNLFLNDLKEGDYKLKILPIDNQNQISPSNTVHEFNISYLDRDTIQVYPEYFLESADLDGDLNFEILTAEVVDETVWLTISNLAGNTLLNQELGETSKILDITCNFGFYNSDSIIDFDLKIESETSTTFEIFSSSSAFNYDHFSYKTPENGISNRVYGSLSNQIRDSLYFYSFSLIDTSSGSSYATQIERISFEQNTANIDAKFEKTDSLQEESLSIYDLNFIDYNNDGLLETYGRSSSGFYLTNSKDTTYINKGDIPFGDAISWLTLDDDNLPDLRYIDEAGIVKQYSFANSFPEEIESTNDILTRGANGTIENIDFFNTGKNSLAYHNLFELYFFEDGISGFERKDLLTFENYLTQVAYLDLNGDDILDLVHGSFKNSINLPLVKAKNNYVIENKKPSTPSSLNTVNRDNEIILHWDPSTDDTTPQDLLTYEIKIYSDAGDVKKSFSNKNGKRRIAKQGEYRSNTAHFLNMDDGTYYWQVQAIDGQFAGSKWSSIDTFIIAHAPQIEGPLDTCENLIVQYRVSPADQNYQWYYDTALATVVDSTNGPKLNLIWKESGTHQLIIENTNYQKFDTINILVKENSTPVFTSTRTSDSIPTLFQLSDHVEQDILSYQWTFIDFDSVSIDSTPIFDFRFFEDHYVDLQVDYKNGCSNSSEQIVEINTPQITGSDTPCIGATYRYEVKPVGHKYSWNVVGGNVKAQTTTSIDIQWLESTGAYIKVSNTSLELSDSIAVNLQDTAKTDFVIPENIGVGAEVEFINTTTGALNYSWEVNNDVYGDKNLNYTFEYPGDYEVTLSSETSAGCYSATSKEVSVSDVLELTIYNAISANHDGINDYLYIKHLERYPQNSISLLTLNGEIIFEQENYSNDWDLIVNGEPLPAGNYICLVKVEGFDEIIKQTVTIIK